MAPKFGWLKKFPPPITRRTALGQTPHFHISLPHQTPVKMARTKQITAGPRTSARSRTIPERMTEYEWVPAGGKHRIWLPLAPATLETLKYRFKQQQDSVRAFVTAGNNFVFDVEVIRGYEVFSQYTGVEAEMWQLWHFEQYHFYRYMFCLTQEVWAVRLMLAMCERSFAIVTAQFQRPARKRVTYLNTGLQDLPTSVHAIISSFADVSHKPDWSADPNLSARQNMDNKDVAVIRLSAALASRLFAVPEVFHHPEMFPPRWLCFEAFRTFAYSFDSDFKAYRKERPSRFTEVCPDVDNLCPDRIRPMHDSLYDMELCDCGECADCRADMN